MSTVIGDPPPQPGYGPDNVPLLPSALPEALLSALPPQLQLLIQQRHALPVPQQQQVCETERKEKLCRQDRPLLTIIQERVYVLICCACVRARVRSEAPHAQASSSFICDHMSR
jgi:hypothetical protein